MELHDLYYSKNYILVIRTRTMSLVGHVARMEERNNAYRVLSGKTAVEGHIENVSLRKILKMNHQEIQLGFGLD